MQEHEADNINYWNMMNFQPFFGKDSNRMKEETETTGRGGHEVHHREQVKSDRRTN